MALPRRSGRGRRLRLRRRGPEPRGDRLPWFPRALAGRLHQAAVCGAGNRARGNVRARHAGGQPPPSDARFLRQRPLRLAGQVNDDRPGPPQRGLPAVARWFAAVLPDEPPVRARAPPKNAMNAEFFVQRARVWSTVRQPLRRSAGRGGGSPPPPWPGRDHQPDLLRIWWLQGCPKWGLPQVLVKSRKFTRHPPM